MVGSGQWWRNDWLHVVGLDMKIASRLLVTRREDRLRDACKQRGEMEEGRPAPMSSSLAVVKGTTSSTKARCRDSLGFQREKGQDTASSWAPDALDWPHVAQVVIPALGSEWVVKSGKKGKQPGLSSRWDEEGDRTIQPRVALSRGGRGCQHAAGGCCQGALQAPLPRQKGDWGGLWLRRLGTFPSATDATPDPRSNEDIRGRPEAGFSVFKKAGGGGSAAP